MSASLVGSEMCIRDSTARAQLSSHAPPVATRMRRPAHPAGSQHRAASSTCLLYTSDAADDM
eukprot:11456680-Alexandrium_andersonii.AAC.1